MPLVKLDPEYARGKRQPPFVPGKGAAMNIAELRQAAGVLENKMRAFLLDSSEKDHCLHDLDAVLCHAEAIILRYDRNGPPVNENLLQRMEATLRLAQDFPDQFRPDFITDLKKNISDLRKKVQ